MPFEAAKCPSCGANIQVPSDVDRAKCMFCGCNLIVREAIQKFHFEVSGHVEVAGISTIENYLLRGQQCLKACDWPRALEIFSAAIDCQANCYRAWLGALFAVTQNMTIIDYSWARFDGAMGIESIALNCLESARKNDFSEAHCHVEKLHHIIWSDASRSRNGCVNSQVSIKNKQRRKKALILFSWGLLITLIGIFTGIQDAGIVFIITAVILLIISIIKAIPLNAGKFGSRIPVDPNTMQLTIFANRIASILNSHPTSA